MTRTIVLPSLFVLLPMAMMQGACHHNSSSTSTPSGEAAQQNTDFASQRDQDFPAIRIVPTIISEDRVYALTEPTPGQPIPEDAIYIPLMEAFAQFAIFDERPLTRAVQLTVVGRDATCVVEATRETRSFMGCPHETEADPSSFTERRALVAEACPGLRLPEEEWSLAWSIEGDHPEIVFEDLEELEVEPTRQARLRELAEAYLRANGLDRDLGSDWWLGELLRIPTMSVDIGVFRGEGFRHVLVLDGDRVSSHLDDGLEPIRIMRISDRVFVEMITSIETRHLYEARGDRLVPITQDGLYLFCGDGLL